MSASPSPLLLCFFVAAAFVAGSATADEVAPSTLSAVAAVEDGGAAAAAAATVAPKPSPYARADTAFQEADANEDASLDKAEFRAFYATHQPGMNVSGQHFFGRQRPKLFASKARRGRGPKQSGPVYCTDWTHSLARTHTSLLALLLPSRTTTTFPRSFAAR